MIYLIDRGFRINNALNILVNQCKYPGIYNECFCLGCSKDNDLQSSFANNVNDNVNQGTCFANDNDNNNDNVNDYLNDKVNFNDNDYVIDNDNDKDNVNDNDNANDNDNDLRSSFANNDNDKDNVNDNDNATDNVFDNDNDNDNNNDNDNVNDNDDVNVTVIDNFIYLFDEKHQRGKPINEECLSNNISWLNVDDKITESAFPDNFRCIISGPSESGKIFLLEN